MSDSHGDAAMTQQAVDLLLRLGATKLFHCGDICSASVLDVLAGHDFAFVWGNCDDPTPQLRRYVADLGLPIPTVPVKARIDGRSIAVFHGHEDEFDEARTAGEFDYIFHGHTHRFGDHREGRCRVINPGALHRARFHTVALLNVPTDALTYHVVETGKPIDR